MCLFPEFISGGRSDWLHIQPTDPKGVDTQFFIERQSSEVGVQVWLSSDWSKLA